MVITVCSKCGYNFQGFPKKGPICTSCGGMLETSDTGNKLFGSEKVGTQVRSILISHGFGDMVSFIDISNNWHVIVGDPLSRKTKPAKLDNRVLTVTVADSAYSHHLTYYSKRILDLIASPEICGEHAVKKIVYHVGDVKLKDDVIFRHIKEKWDNLNLSSRAKKCIPSKFSEGVLELSIPQFMYSLASSIDEEIRKALDSIIMYDIKNLVTSIKFAPMSNKDAYLSKLINHDELKEINKELAEADKIFMEENEKNINTVSDDKLRKRFSSFMKSAQIRKKRNEDDN